MKSTRKKTILVPAEAIARLADEGKDISRLFSNSGRMMEPIQRLDARPRRGGKQSASSR
jgi:hypothetical protein